MPTLCGLRGVPCRPHRDRKSTRLNSSHTVISYAVFCLKKKKTSLNSSHTVISNATFYLKKNSSQQQISRQTATWIGVEAKRSKIDVSSSEGGTIESTML